MNARTLASLSAQAPTAYELLRRSDVLRRIGLERRRSHARRAASCAGLLGLGAVLGGAAALLFSPRNGAEMRDRLSKQARRARDYVAAERYDTSSSRPRPSSASASAE